MSLAVYPLTALAAALSPGASLHDADWAAEKCELYQLAVRDAAEIVGTSDLRPEFLAQNDAFIASGCTSQAPVCAETKGEIALADLLTVMTMNEGMASTFVPFSCKPAT